MRTIICVGIIVLAISVASHAQEREGDLAVLEISFQGKELTRQQKEFLSDDIRQAAMELTRYRIMTKESVFAILRDKNIDPGKCADAECEVEFGRKLQADRLVTSTMLFSDQVYYIKIKIYDVGRASMENAVDKECERCSFGALRKAVRETAKELFGGKVGAVPEKVKEEVDVREGMEAVSAILEPDIGWLTVRSEPSGSDVVINGRGVGKTPIESMEVRPGTYEVVVRGAGHYDATRRVRVERGKTGDIALRLEPRTVVGGITRREEVREAVEKAKEPIGIFIYPAINCYLGDINGLNYGGGLGYRIVKFAAVGAQFTTGELSKNDVSGSSSFIELYAMLGLDIIKKGYLGGYVKPGANYQSIMGEGIEKTGIGIRGEAGLYSFPRPICIFIGGFMGKVTSGLTLSIGGYF